MRISDWSSDVCSSDLPKTSRSRLERQKRGWTAPGNRSGFQRPPGGPGNRTPWTPLHDGVSGVRLGNRGRAIFEATPARSPTRPPIEYWRSEELRVGKECVSTGRSRWSPNQYKKKKKK